MTPINQRNSLDKQISNYVRFMKICPTNQVVKLAKEISRLQARVSVIRNMEHEQLHTDVPFFFETKQSKMNFKTI